MEAFDEGLGRRAEIGEGETTVTLDWLTFGLRAYGIRQCQTLIWPQTLNLPEICGINIFRATAARGRRRTGPVIEV